MTKFGEGYLMKGKSSPISRIRQANEVLYREPRRESCMAWYRISFNRVIS
jgi:hypothetical protein